MRTARRPDRGLAGVALAAVAALALAGCTAGPSSAPTPGGPSTAGSVSSPPAASSSPSSPTSSTTPSSSPSVENSYTPPAKTPGRPDPSTAGRLTARTFPNPVLGFTGTVVDPEEGEYNENGTWVHAIDGTQAAYESMPQCTAVSLGQIPRPRAALSGTYRDAQDDPGNALALEFGDETTAQAFFTLYARQLKACPSSGGGMPMVTELSVSGDVLTGRRTYSEQEKWSEMIKRNRTVVVLIILADQHRTSPARLAAAAEKI